MKKYTDVRQRDSLGRRNIKFEAESKQRGVEPEEQLKFIQQMFQALIKRIDIIKEKIDKGKEKRRKEFGDFSRSFIAKEEQRIKERQHMLVECQKDCENCRN